MVYDWANNPYTPHADVYDADGVRYGAMLWVDTETGEGEQWQDGAQVRIRLRPPVRVVSKR